MAECSKSIRPFGLRLMTHRQTTLMHNFGPGGQNIKNVLHIHFLFQIITQVFMVSVCDTAGHDFKNTDLKEEKIPRNHIGHEHELMSLKEMSDCSV